MKVVFRGKSIRKIEKFERNYNSYRSKNAHTLKKVACIHFIFVLLRLALPLPVVTCAGSYCRDVVSRGDWS